MRNPWIPKTFNLTQQMILTKRDPALAGSLRADALREAAASPKPKQTYQHVRHKLRSAISAEMRELDRIRAEYHAAKLK